MENKKVLIVDDNNLNRKVFENIISHDYQFETAENGQEAIGKIKYQCYDLILMDIQMPVMDGITALKIIKEENLTLAPVIAISAFSNQNDREYFLSAGFDEFIAKPVKPKHLLESIYYQLYNSEKQKRNIEIPTEIPEILDAKVFDQLKKYNSDENIKMVYEDFMEEAQEIINEIGNLVKQNSFADIGEKLHILKGNSGTLGAKKLFIEAGKFEQKIKDVNFEDIEEDYLTLQNHFTNFKNHLHQRNNHR
ncbi:response regulator [Echinicola marina]|uniref:response regulator n=1 Tax=Echinicola marina TaxID=2859768 RepID=UPI001CF6655F|nr:response regulator [Echinicola marina]UCS95617.1 response regulator [Echinicola marina]